MIPSTRGSATHERGAALENKNKQEEQRPSSSSAAKEKNRQGSGTSSIGTFLTFSAVVAILVYGWINRSTSIIHAENGLGYTLGIAGGVSMLLLLLYPVRKKVRLLQKLGLIKHWFRTHMFLGVAGPVMILFHCNFQTGSLNSNVALFSMLLVAASGLVGRFLYRHIHNGLYGHKSSLTDLRRNLQYRKQVLDTSFAFSPTIAQQLLVLEQNALRNKNLLLHILSLPLNSFRMMYSRMLINRAVIQDLKQQSVTGNWDRATLRAAQKEANALVKDYVKTVQKAADLSAYERLFSLWHYLHLPFFIMLVITGIIHVIAVHMY